VNEWLLLVASGIFGALLGLVFFLGLWATVRRLETTGNPVLWILGSLVLRFSFVLAGFFLLAHYGGWEHLLVAAVSFTLPRLFMVRRMQPHQFKEESNP
jgi:F1F0 ATPase subunit 2